MCSPLVSIIIPVYNVSDYIERCLKSVITQTYRHIECVIVDDGSPDDSMDKCYSLLNQYDGPIIFSVVTHESNLGLSAARNSGIDKAQGEYLFFLDSDDELFSYSIQCMVEITELYPNVEMVQGLRIKPRNGVNKARTPRFLYDTDYIEDNNWVRAHYYCIGERLPGQAMNKLIRKDFLQNHRLYFKVGLIHEDELWMYFVVKKMKNYAVVKKETYIYHENPHSIMATATPLRTAYYWGYIFSDVFESIDYPYFEGQLYTYLYTFLRKYDGSISNYPKYVELANRFAKLLSQRGHFLVAILLLTYTYLLPINYMRIGKHSMMREIKTLWTKSLTTGQNYGIH